MAIRVWLNPLNRELNVERGAILLEALREAGVRIESLCGGKGKCGKCKVILEKGEVEKVDAEPDKLLSFRELAEGYHLACMLRIAGDCTFTIPAESRIESPKILISGELKVDEMDTGVRKFPFIVLSIMDSPLLFRHRRFQLEGYTGLQPRIGDEIYGRIDRMAPNERYTATLTRTGGFPEIIEVQSGDRSDQSYGLALDMGTTTVVSLLVDLKSGKILARGSEMNLQITYGEELVTRIAYAGEGDGLIKLQRAATRSIDEVISHMCKEAKIEPGDISECCVGGNTVMNHLLVGLDPGYLDEANVSVSKEPIIRKARSVGLNINPEAYVYCLPNVSRFLGGDAVGDVIASGMHESDETSLLVDLGTNGEIIFGSRSWLYSSSCASGPAFEGEGVRHGMRGAKGGIEHVKIDPATFRAEVSVIGDVSPKGICGSGIVDVTAEMFKVGILDFVGKFVPRKTSMVREGRNGLEYVIVPAEETATSYDIVITQADLDYVIDSKAAACGAITVLMKKLKLSIKDVKNLYLAGAFGTYTDLGNAVTLGIFPEFPNAKVHPIGNGSLSGAYAALLSMRKRDQAREIVEKMVYVDLLVDIEFMEEYANALYIPGNKEFFPSYKPGMK